MAAKVKLKVCTQCGAEKPASEFHRNCGRLRNECAECRRPSIAQYARDHHPSLTPCYFCGEPSSYLNYCRKHWHQYRDEHINSHPDFAKFFQMIQELCHHFGITPNELLFSASQRNELTHYRMITLFIIKNLTQVKYEKLAVMFTRNTSSVIRLVHKATRFYALYPQFQTEVSAAVAHLQATGYAK